MIHAAFQYFREINRQLQKVLGNETAPLVLAGVDYNLPLYRNATSYAHVLNEGIYGNLRIHPGYDGLPSTGRSHIFGDRRHLK